MNNHLSYNIIDPQVFVGACPQTPEDVEHLKQQISVTAVLTLQTDDDRRLYRLDWGQLRRAYQHVGAQVVELPIEDKSEEALAEHLRRAVDRLDELVQQGHSVLLHCNIGNGRSPTVAAAWLCWRRDWSLEDAVAHLRACRNCEPNPNVIQRAEKISR